MGSQQAKQHRLDLADKNCIQNSGVETCLKFGILQTKIKDTE
jgi:hypothetical protein